MEGTSRAPPTSRAISWLRCPRRFPTPSGHRTLDREAGAARPQTGHLRSPAKPSKSIPGSSKSPRRSSPSGGPAEPRHPHPHHRFKGTNMETQKFSYFRSQKNYFLRMSFSFSSLYYSEVKVSREFPGSPVIRAPDFHCRGPRFHPWLEN